MRIENDLLYPLVAAGDQDAAKRMIEGNMRLVYYRVQRYLSGKPSFAYLRDDLVSAGFVGLTIAVQKLGAKGPVPDANATEFIGRWITHHIDTEANRYNAANVSRRTLQRSKKRRPKNVRSTEGLVKADPMTDPQAVDEMRETILACCDDNIDTEIVKLRDDPHGMNDAEISAALNVPKSSVFCRRKKIYERYLETLLLPRAARHGVFSCAASCRKKGLCRLYFLPSASNLQNVLDSGLLANAL